MQPAPPFIDCMQPPCYEARINLCDRSKLKTREFEELKSLDLRQCESVGDIVAAMRYCAFGARMLGEVANTIRQMIVSNENQTIIYDGVEDSQLGLLLREFVKNKWARKILLPSQYAKQKPSGENILVIGGFSERCAEAIYTKPARAIFINPFDMARPGQIKDGYFPDAVFADPRYVMPVLYWALDEWINDRPTSAGSLVTELAAYGASAPDMTGDSLVVRVTFISSD